MKNKFVPSPAPPAFEKKLEFRIEKEASSDKGNKYLITFYAEANNNLLITAKKNSDILNKFFSNKFSVEKIKENKYMNMYDDLKEICTELSEIIKSKSLNLIEEDKSLIISVPLPNVKIKEIIFDLNENPINENDDTNELKTLVLELKKENELLKKEINEIKTEFKKEIDNLINITNNQNNEIIKLKQELKKFGMNDLLQINSLIINDNDNYKKILKYWINPNINLSGQLLYRLTRDGEQISKFHELCNNKGPTLLIFKTEDGNIGGLFTPLSWDDNSMEKKDMKSFLFNLTKYKKFDKKKNDFSIYAIKDYGPWCYGFGFLHIMNLITHKGKCINEYYINGSDILPNDCHSPKYFNAVEVEIFEIMI